VNDIIEVTNFAALPTTGESSKIYVTLDTHKAYRWSGSSYVEISASLVIGTTSGTAYDGGSGQTNANNILLKANLSSPTFTGTVNGITKSMVGLADVDNTSDVNKPVSNATITQLLLKSNLANPTFTGTVNGITKNMVGLADVDNISITTIGGTNLTYTNNKLNLDADLTSLNSIESSTNTDLQLESSGTGNILLIAAPNTSTIGYIHLARADDPSQRFNTIAYSTNGNSSYIALNVHYTAGANNLTREVLKLNSDLSAEFAGNVVTPQLVINTASAIYDSSPSNNGTD
jgi:hypothetical protein